MPRETQKTCHIAELLFLLKKGTLPNSKGKKILKKGIFFYFSSMKNKISLLTWMATNNDPNLISDLRVKLVHDEKFALQKIYYLYTAKDFSKQEHILDILKKVKACCPELEPIPVDIEDPTKHKVIYDQLKKCLEPRLPEMGRLCINLTAGTPAMHAVWLLLYAGGFFHQDTILYSPQVIGKNSENPIKRLDKVDFEINTYLSSIRNFAESNPDKPIFFPEPLSKERKKAFAEIRQYINVPEASLLIIGERGCGKTNFVETWVKAITHKNVITVVCGSLDEDRFEARLFGYDPGAFTGANPKGSKGLIEDAKDNILFFDEVQDLSPRTQRKLLRVLNEHKYNKFQGTQEKDIDFELICATNIPVDELKKRLYPDFYDRICMYKVKFPPLRECREDLDNDWKGVWKSIGKGLVKGPEGSEWDVLKKYLENSKLSGNFRSLRRIAFQWLAWKGVKNMQEIIDDVKSEDELSDCQEFQIERFPEFQGLTMKDATELFRKKISTWALNKCKSAKEAARILDCDEKTIRNHSV